MTNPNPYGQQPIPPAGQPNQPPYGAAPAAPYSPYPPTQPTNTLAIIALVGSLIIPIAGIICGHIALNQIKRTGEQGRGLALAGLIIGYVYTAIIVLIVIFYVIVMVLILGTAATYSTY